MNHQEHKKLLAALSEFATTTNVIVMEMGNIAYNQTMDNFTKQGYTDETLTKWKDRKYTEKGRGSRGILMGKGTGTSGLKGSYRKVRRSALAISIVNNKVYSSVHNEGLRAGRGRGFIMPERKMIGDSALMRRNIYKMINTNIRKIWQS